MGWAFVNKGSFKEYYTDEEVNEVITNLFMDGTWALNHTSFTGRKPSKSKIEAFEESEVFFINIEDFS